MTLEHLVQLAESHYLAARALRCELEDLQKLQLPAIAHVDFDHFVVIERSSAERLIILDPASGRLELGFKAFSKRFTGIVLETQPTPMFEKKDEHRKSRTIGFLTQLPVVQLAVPLLGVLLFSVAIQAFALMTPFFLQVMVDEVFIANDGDLALVVCLSFAAIYVISAITQALRGLLTIKIGATLSYVMSAGMLRHITNLPVRFFERRNIGDIVSRFGSMNPLQDFIAESLVGIFLDVLMITTTFAMICLYSIQAALYVSLVCLAYLLAQYLLTLPYRRHRHEQLIADANVQSHFIETIQAIDSIKRFEGIGRRRAAWLNRLVLSLNAQVRARYWQLAADIIRYLFLGLLLLGVVYLSVEEVSLGLLTIGMLYTLVTYSNHFANALVSLTHEWQAYLMLSLHVQRMSDITEHEPDNRPSFELQKPVTKIRLKNLAFGHKNAALLFQGLDLEIRGNEKVAIIGASGSGKSTLLSLLRGELSPTEGQVLLDNRPLTTGLDPSALYTVLQHNDVLLTGTVTDNIAFMEPCPDRDRVLIAARTALVHDDILRLPMAYREKLSEQGCTLSTGQRQRILIARALYRKADVLLLDEATSHLDPAKEMRIMQNILSLPIPCFFITHRPDIASLADHIIELPPAVQQQEQLGFAAG